MKSLSEAKAQFGAVQSKDPGVTMRILKIEKAFQGMVDDIYDLVPDNADRTAGLRALLNAKWTLTHAVTHQSAPSHAAPEKKNAKEKEKDT